MSEQAAGHDRVLLVELEAVFAQHVLHQGRQVAGVEGAGVVGNGAGRPSPPIRRTPWRSTVWPQTVPAQLPPWATAKSTTTEPGRIPASISSEISMGARRPGTWAVQITMSARAS